MEALLNDLIRYKTEQTVEFFAQVYGKAPNPDAIRLLMGSQFGYFKQLLDEHMGGRADARLPTRAAGLL